MVVVHNFSRFFRDHFELELYVRELAKNGVRVVSITQEMGEDPMHVMTRQIMALFDEYQSIDQARERIRINGGAYRRDHLRPLAQRVEIADRDVHVIGSKSNLLQTLTAAAGAKPATPASQFLF